MKFLIFEHNYHKFGNSKYYELWTKIHRRRFITNSILNLPTEDQLRVLHDNEEVLVYRGLLDSSQRFYVL